MGTARRLQAPIRFPVETDAPWVIDADGVLDFPVAFMNFQTIAGWDGRMVECLENRRADFA
jgi:hypothetical protein